MNIKTLKNGFLGINQGKNFQTPYGKARAAVIPFGLEKTVSYGKGTKFGPKAIIEASHYLEVLDEQTLKLPYKAGIATLKEPAIPEKPEMYIRQLSEITRQVVLDGKFPIVLGGEHSLTQGTVAGLSQKYKNFTVLHFDAHSDTRTDYYIGSSFSHGAVMSQVLTKYPIKKLVQVGVRSIANEDGELAFRKRNQNKITTFWAWDKFAASDVVREIPTRDVFISFDVDAFDPSIMPATGTPEPGGILWRQALDILKAVFAAKNVIGADVVELSPIKNLRHPDFTTAKLVYKIIGYKFFPG